MQLNTIPDKIPNMSERFWDSNGNEYESWGGMVWLMGKDESKAKKRTRKEKREIKKKMAQLNYDIENTPIDVTAPRNILADFIDQLTSEIEFAAMIEEASGKRVDWGNENSNPKLGKEK